MKKILISLVSLAVAFYVGNFLLQLLIARDFMTQVNECHGELHLKDRINEQMSNTEIDDLHAEWAGCVKQKGNFLDHVFGSKLLDEFMNASKEDRKTNGPFNRRQNRHVPEVNGGTD